MKQVCEQIAAENDGRQTAEEGSITFAYKRLGLCIAEIERLKKENADMLQSHLRKNQIIQEYEN